MKQTRRNSTTGVTGVTTAMRVIVPLQGVVQGRGDLVLGSIIPCALFYFFQLYLKRKNRTSDDSATPTPPQPSEISPPGGRLQRVKSVRSIWSPRGANSQAQVSSRANSVIKQPNYPYYVGLKRASEDPYDESSNPEGIIQLGLDENKLSLDLVQDWLMAHTKCSINGQELPLNGITTYHPFHGISELKVAVAGFMSRVMEGCVLFDPSHIVLTCGVAPGIEMLAFCLADPGNAFLVPSPYHPDKLQISLRTKIRRRRRQRNTWLLILGGQRSEDDKEEENGIGLPHRHSVRTKIRRRRRSRNGRGTKPAN